MPKKIITIVAVLVSLMATTAYALSAATIPQGGTGWANIQTGAIPYGQGTTRLATTSQGTGILAWLNSIPTWTSSSSLNLTVGTFLSPNISQWTNNAGYLTSLAGAASSTLLGDNNTFTGTNIFSNALSTFAGLAAKATILATARTINGVSFDGSANITIASTTLLANNNTWTGINGFQAFTFTNGTGTNATTTGNFFTNTLGANGPITVGTSTASTTIFGNSTSTFAGGINLSQGQCFAVGGTCLQTTISSTADYKQASQYATISALPANIYANGSSGVGATLTEVGTGALSVDGSTPSVGDRILVKNEATGANNGIYTVTAVGSGIAAYVLTRATDYNNTADIYPGTATYVISGTVNNDTTWVLTTAAPIVVGTTALVFAENGFSNTRLINTTYPLQGGGDLSADRTLTLAFGTTSNINWSGLHVFQGASTTFVGNVSITGNSTTTNATTTTHYSNIFTGDRAVFGTSTASTTIYGNSTSTFPSAIKAACFSVDGTTCLTSGSTLSVGGTGAVQFANGTAFNGQSTFFFDSSNIRLGIGSSTPFAKLSVVSTLGGSVIPLLNVSSSTAGLATATAMYIDPFGNVGIGTTSPAKPFEVFGTTAGGVARIHRVNASTNGILGTYDILGESSGGQITDGFGAAQTFSVEDADQVINIIGDVVATRSGADNTGKMQIRAYNAGSVSTSNNLTITSGGLLGVSSSSPYAMLSVAGLAVVQNIVATSTSATSTIAASFAVGSSTPFNLPQGTFLVGSSSPLFSVNGTSGMVGIGTSTWVGVNRPSLNIDMTGNTSETGVNLYAALSDFVNYNCINNSTGANAECGYAATADTGGATSNFMYLGKNNSKFWNRQTYTVGGNLDSTLLSLGGTTGIAGGLFIAQGTSGNALHFLNGGTSTSTNEVMTITGTGNAAKFGIGTSTPPLPGLTIASGTLAVAEYVDATSTYNVILWASSTQHLYRMGGAAFTMTFASSTVDAIPGQTLRVQICNPSGSTAGAITWVDTVTNRIRWPGPAYTQPTQTTTANHCDVWSFVGTLGTSTVIYEGNMSPY